jgi:hypothetical protein
MAPRSEQAGTQEIVVSVQQGKQESLNQGGNRQEFFTAVPFQQARAFKGQFGFAIPDRDFNGLITNDKFCMTRTGQLQLSHWRRPLRLRASTSVQKVYSDSEKSEYGGNHETPVEDFSRSTGISGRTAPLVSSLSLGIGDRSLQRSEPDANEPGGATCE